MKIKADRLFRAFADESRLRILKLLSDGELCVCDLMGALRMGQSKVSRHLAYLARHGLIACREDGRWSYYSLATPQDKLRRLLIGCIDECCDDAVPFRRDAARLKNGKERCDS